LVVAKGHVPRPVNTGLTHVKLHEPSGAADSIFNSIQAELSLESFPRPMVYRSARRNNFDMVSSFDHTKGPGSDTCSPTSEALPSNRQYYSSYQRMYLILFFIPQQRREHCKSPRSKYLLPWFDGSLDDDLCGMVIAGLLGSTTIQQYSHRHRSPALSGQVIGISPLRTLVRNIG